ncbi:hypothetical protein L227DRAFT_160822 [Lentinus tigrinus ALCF2SS1-6]|uniref:Uncharacterized protein n=1 Tax=Lentinus tigrinus ALCF2SS1-6 TaxID=1328759 RepID=A0A5C2S8N1_9APHY|nr:hypothetical protein L227DRAFT_160822 [Lentinus tigrinus ALCF2SS1-6]
MVGKEMQVDVSFKAMDGNTVQYNTRDQLLQVTRTRRRATRDRLETTQSRTRIQNDSASDRRGTGTERKIQFTFHKNRIAREETQHKKNATGETEATVGVYPNTPHPPARRPARTIATDRLQSGCAAANGVRHPNPRTQPGRLTRSATRPGAHNPRGHAPRVPRSHSRRPPGAREVAFPFLPSSLCVISRTSLPGLSVRSRACPCASRFPRMPDARCGVRGVYVVRVHDDDYLLSVEE